MVRSREDVADLLSPEGTGGDVSMEALSREHVRQMSAHERK